jgi:acetyltransferase-like isoleucine patch superfamily enzyme
MTNILRVLAEIIAVPLVVPAYLLYQISRLILGTSKAFPGWSQAFSLIPGLTGVYLRRAFYRMVLPRCGHRCFIGFGTVLTHSETEVGRLSYLGVFCCLGHVAIEDDVLIGSHVSIMNGGSQHGIDRLDIPVREQPGIWPRVTIGCDTWIGERAIIQADVGKHCVIGAGAVVTQALPDYAVAIGVPARIIRYRQGAPVNGAGTEAALHEEDSDGEVSSTEHTAQRRGIKSP